MASKSVSVDVEVNVELSDFEIEEIALHVIKNIEEVSEEKKFLLKRALNMSVLETIEIDSINEQMKFEYIRKIFGKYSLEKLETLLPE